MDPAKSKEKYLESVYYDMKKPGSFTGVAKLWVAIKRDGNPLHVKYKDVQNWLSTQPTYALHKPPKEKFERERIIVGEIDEQWDADLMDVQKFSRKNQGVKYLAVFIDLFSRYLWVEPLKSKTGEEMLQAVQRVFDKGRKPKTLRTDQGKEYVAKVVQEFLKTQDVNHIIAYNVYHANYAERVIRTIKGRLYRFFTRYQTHEYIPHLQDMIDSYNDSRHSSIGMAPAEVTEKNQQELYEKLYLPIELEREKAKVKFEYDIGDRVRMSYARRPFQRGYEEKWSEEVFVISKRIPSHPPRYHLVDTQNEEIRGTFYEQELQRAYVKDGDIFKVERVLRYRIKDGKRQGLIRWKGYGKKFDSWEDAAAIKNYE